MNVRLGWSGDIHGTWTKMDVEVDHSDLQQLFAEHGMDPDTTVTPLEKFKIMYTMAETFVQLHKMSRFPAVFGSEQDQKELRELVDSQKKLMASIGKREVQ